MSRIYLGFAAVLLLGAALLSPDADASWAVSSLDGAKGLILAQSSPVDYAPGVAVEVIVTINSLDTTGILALGLVESLPDGWTYASTRAISGQAPSITPQTGASGSLDYAWITVPSLPYSFAFSVMPPAESGGTVSIEGQLEYRLSGGAIFPDPVNTVLYGPDSVVPAITLLGDNPVVIEQGIPYVEPGWVATGSEGEDLHDAVEVVGTVDFMTPGDYTLMYSVSTAEGLPAFPVARAVQVTEAPCKGPLCCYGTPGAANGVSAGDLAAAFALLFVLLVWPRRISRGRIRI